MRRSGLGDAGADAVNAISSQVDPQTAAQLQAYYANAQRVQQAAAPVVQALAAGQVPDPGAMTALLALGAGIAGLGPAGVAVAAMLPTLDVAVDIAKAFLSPLGLLASGSTGNGDQFCGRIDTTRGEHPPALDGSNWQPLPLPDCGSFPNQQPSCDFSSSGVSTDGLAGQGVQEALYTLHYSPPGTFPELYARAILYNQLLRWNCQPSYIRDFQTILKACVQLWNATHTNATTVTIVPVPIPDFHQPALDWSNPWTFVGTTAYGVYSPPGVPQMDNTVVNTGPMLPITRPPIGLRPPSPILVNPGGASSSSTAKKVAVGAVAVGGLAAAGIGVLAYLKGWGYKYAASKVWDKTGGRAIDEIKKVFK